MKKYLWILKAAMHMRVIFSWWKPRDLAFCWETAATLYYSYEYDGDEPVDPVDAILEEISYWNDWGIKTTTCKLF